MEVSSHASGYSQQSGTPRFRDDPPPVTSPRRFRGRRAARMPKRPPISMVAAELPIAAIWFALAAMPAADALFMLPTR